MRNPLAVGRLALQRALASPGLTALRVCSVLVAVTLVAAVSLYSTALGDAMLQGSLHTDQGSLNLAVSETSKPLAGTAYTALDRYVRQQEQRDLGLPLGGLHVHHNTSTVPLYRLADLSRRAKVAPLSALALHYYAGFATHVVVIAGALSLPEARARGAAPVVVSQYTAQSLHLALGARLVYAQDGRTPLARPLIVCGIYVPKDVNSDLWDINAGLPTYRSLVATRLSDFLSVAAANPAFSPEYFWLYHTRLDAIHLDAAPAILDQLQRIGSRVADIAPGATLFTPLDLDINGFLYQYALLPYILLILVVPILALILYAGSVIATLILDRQAAEIALLRSRGASRVQIVALYVVEGLGASVLAVALGPVLGLPVARLIGHASGFLQFNATLPFSLRLTPITYLLAVGTALATLVVGVIPAVRAARRSLLVVKGTQGRSGQRPLWQRLYLDAALLAVALYGLWVLVRQGPVNSSAGTAALAQDPVIGVAPLVFAVALTLFVSRVVPALARGAGAALAALLHPPAYVALQGVARAPREPMRLVQLCTLTLTLGVFAATVAGVEAVNRLDQQVYDAGTQLRLGEFDALHKQWHIMPLADHLRLPGVRAVTPALRFESFGDTINSTGDGTAVNVLGIDPATAGRVMWFRPDFAGQPFKRLLAILRAPGPNAIVSDTFLGATGLHAGDTTTVTLASGKSVTLRVAAVAHYFPTLDPHAYPFVVANLAYLTRVTRSPGPSEVWLATDPFQATVDRLLSVARTWPRRIIDYQGLTARFSAQDEPLTAGVYGVVSVGFLIALALAILGFVAYAYLSLQRRRAEFAIVRALGLSSGQLRWLVLCEQLFLVGAGVVGGIVTGLLTTELFLPYLPIAAHTLPPFLVVMPWGAVAAFIGAALAVFVLVLSLHVWMLLRLHLGHVLRLGEG